MDEVDDIADVLVRPHRHPPGEVLAPPLHVVVDHGIHAVGHQDVRTAHGVAAPAQAQYAIRGLLAAKLGDLVIETDIGELGARVDEVEMGLVHAVLELAEEAPAPPAFPHLGKAIAGEDVELGKGGRLAGPEIGEDEAEILAHGPGGDAHPVCEAVALRRLVDAAPLGVVFPAVIEAADALALDAPDREFESAVGAGGR